MVKKKNDIIYDAVKKITPIRLKRSKIHQKISLAPPTPVKQQITQSSRPLKTLIYFVAKYAFRKYFFFIYNQVVL